MITARTPRTHAERRASRDGYFAPESVIRRVVGSPLISLLGAGPAALLQVAHPLVAASVVAQPDYRERVWGRWLHTVRTLYLLVFGSKAEADHAIETVLAVHARVHGTTTEALGPFPAGTPFAASDPALMLWVHAALVEVVLAAYSRLGGRLGPEDEGRLHAEMALIAQLVGVPRDIVPATASTFREYVDAELAGPRIVVTEPARAVAATILDAPLPIAMRGLLPAHRLSTAGLLPASLRVQYGLQWGPGRAAALKLAVASLRAGVFPLLLAAERIPVPGRLLAAAV
jgi:uncharacterized protein (DUF2236 family)